jgi:hypothetical protein
MQQLTTSQYLSGIWSDDLEYSLLWIGDHTHAWSPVQWMPVRRYTPSWSWASVDGPVAYIHRHRDQFTHWGSGEDKVIEPVLIVVRARITLSTANAYRPTSQGLVTLRGQLLPVYYNAARKLWRPNPPASPSPTPPPPQARRRSIIDVLRRRPKTKPREAGLWECDASLWAPEADV